MSLESVAWQPLSPPLANVPVAPPSLIPCTYPSDPLSLYFSLCLSLCSFLDTYAPFANLPLPINGPEIAVVMSLLDAVLGNATAGVTVYSMITWPLNQRLKTSCTTLRCALGAINANKQAGLRPASFAEAVAIPENDDW